MGWNLDCFIKALHPYATSLQIQQKASQFCFLVHPDHIIMQFHGKVKNRQVNFLYIIKYDGARMIHFTWEAGINNIL